MDVVEHLSTETLILGPLNLFVLISIVIFVLFHLGRVTYDRHNRREHSILFPYYIRQWGLKASRPLKSLVKTLGLKPNHLSLAGVILMALSGVAFAFRLTGLGAWAIALGGLMDVFDGMVARETNSTSKQGAFVDSSLDRYGEGAMFLGLLIGFWHFGVLHTAAIVAAMLGSLLVSYTKARGEALGVSCSKGIMQRPERLLIMALGTGMDPILNLFGISGYYGTLSAIWIVAILSHVTVVQRIFLISRKLDSVDNEPS